MENEMSEETTPLETTPDAPQDLLATTPPPAAPARGKTLVKARVLTDGAFGKGNDVVTVSAAVAKAHPELDADPDSVAYAESLKTSE